MMRPRTLRLLNRLLFGLTALPYDLLTRRPLWREHCRGLLAELPPAAPRRILDLGCGPGVSALEMLAAGNDTAVGVDLSAPMLVRARQHAQARGLSDRLLLVRADVTALPFKEGAFHAATAHSVLYLLPDKLAALHDTRRALRRGGVLVSVDPSPGHRLRELLSLIRAHPSFSLTALLWRLVSRAAGRPTPEVMRRYLAQAGFEPPQLRSTLGDLGVMTRARVPD